MASTEIDRAVEQYTALQPDLQRASDAFVALVTSIIDDAGINYLSVTGRAKTVLSFAGKAHRLQERRPGEEIAPMREITDQVGVRVITYVQSDILAVANLLTEQLNVLDDRDLGVETAQQGGFGYASRHLLVSLDHGADTAYEPLRCASVQLRTVLQHAWAEFEHDIRYKGTVPPGQVPDLDRRFTLAAGLLELADREFSTIRDRLQEGLGESSVPAHEEDPRISPQELATFLAGRYASAGWSRTDHYEWICGLLLELGIASLDELSASLIAIDSAALTRSMDYRYAPGAVRRLDDDLLARFGERYVMLHGNAHRRDALGARLDKLILANAAGPHGAAGPPSPASAPSPAGAPRPARPASTAPPGRPGVPVRIDLTVLAIPAFVGAMGAEYAWQRRHPAPPGTVRAGDYELADTLTSLTMGLGSLLAPFVTRRLLDPVTPGIGRHARTLMGLGLAAAVATTVNDVRRSYAAGRLLEAGTLPAGDRGEPSASDPARPGGPLRRLDGAAAVAAVGATALTVATTWAARTSGKRLFARRGRDLGTGALANGVAILGWDAIYYWNHRLAHECRWLWAMHVVHHSSERYNLSTALRQPVADGFTVGVPYGLLCLVGVRPAVVENARALNLIYQFWIHTEAVRSIGRLEKILNTPSHHRVHHGSNRRYLDRNHGSILIIWDRIFGTFEPETEPVVYGLTRPIDTFNPVRVATHEWRDIAADVAAATTWRERFSFLVRGPGWAYAHRDPGRTTTASVGS